MVVMLSSQVLTKSKSPHSSIQSCQPDGFQKGLGGGPAFACPITVGEQIFELTSFWEEEGCCDRDIRWEFELVSWEGSLPGFLRSPFCYVDFNSWFDLLRHTLEVQMLVWHLTPSYVLYSAVLSAVSVGNWYVNSYYSLSLCPFFIPLCLWDLQRRDCISEVFRKHRTCR